MSNKKSRRFKGKSDKIIEKYGNGLFAGILLLIGMLLAFGILACDSGVFSYGSISFGDIGVWFAGMVALIAILGVSWNTNRQIENQNKQMHRPYLKMSTINFSKERLETTNYLDLWSKNSTPIRIGVRITKGGFGNLPCIYLDLKMENTGIGLATNIAFYNVYSKKFTSRVLGYTLTQGTGVALRAGYYSSIRIKKDRDEVIKFKLTYNLEERFPDIFEDYASGILIYSDINNNIYKTIISYSINKNIKVNECINIDYTEHPSETIQFREFLSSKSIDENKVEKLYKEQFTNSED